MPFLDKFAQDHCIYMIYGKEVGESGTPHLQGFMQLKTRLRITQLRKLGMKCHMEVRSKKSTPQEASDYCKKEGDYVEYGMLQNQGKRTDLERVTELIKEGSTLQHVAEECPESYIKFHRGIAALKLALDRPYDHDDVRGYWFYGPPGTGKSRTARDENPGAYLKPQSKWFDGYAGEEAIILDDLDTNVLGHYLKIWADRYACTGETKGGTINLRHKKFIVTSNYSIDCLWPEDKHMREAIKRRFTEVYFGDERDKFTDGHSHSSTFNFPE